MKRDGVFLFVISSLVLEIFMIFYYANYITDDIINCFNIVPKHKMTKISANSKEMHMKLGNSIVL